MAGVEIQPTCSEVVIVQPAGGYSFDTVCFTFV